MLCTLNHNTFLKMKTLLLYISVVLLCSCVHAQGVTVGAERMDTYLHLLESKQVALVVNQTSMVGGVHLVDTLLSRGVDVETIFAPEHGFRGQADAGEHVGNGKDAQTGLPIISLYGNNKKPTTEQLRGIDVVVFDIQDVGVRFYTYISTMHYMMEACAENDIPFVVLDRPNPNGHYIDGPVLEEGYTSFVGMHPIPVVHGLTVGELARMINGEGWLSGGVWCDLAVVSVVGWQHADVYSLPVKPSPNLPNDVSINLYPSLCFFEPTVVSVGRGTYYPFQCVGSVSDSACDFTFTPMGIDGMSRHPKHEGVACHGFDLRESSMKRELDISYLLLFYNNCPDKDAFFTDSRFFNLLAGNKMLQEQVKTQKSVSEIRQSWQKGLDFYRNRRKAYLLYP